MSIIALCVAWFAVAGIVLLALAEYRKPASAMPAHGGANTGRAATKGSILAKVTEAEPAVGLAKVDRVVHAD